MRAARILSSLGLAALTAAVAASQLRGTATSVARHGDQTRADTAVSLDPIARLQARLDAGELTLAHDSTLGYLPALLRALEIPVSSQGFVFSRTSLQTDLITPWTPRALYFNDDVYVGYVQGSDFLEIATVSPSAGAAFYTLDQTPRGKPSFTREGNSCLMCHRSRATSGVQGFIMLSTVADRHGYAITSASGGSVTDATPIKQRFGGWYVTGRYGAVGHSGNVYSPKLYQEISDKLAYRREIDLTVESARMDLKGKFDTSPYLSGHSDIVALMTLAHQTAVHNLINTAQELTKEVLREEFVASGGRQGSTRDSTRDSMLDLSLATSNVRLRGAIENLTRAMLFIDETKLEAPLEGTTTFARDFAAMGPRDARGRSLRDFDLERRLFRYPLSFLVYSRGFNDMPPLAKEAVYARLRTILAGRDPNPDYAALSADDRAAVLEILTATKPDFARDGTRGIRVAN